MQATLFSLLAKLLANPYLSLLLLILFCAVLYILYRLFHRPAPIRYGQPVSIDHSKKQPCKTLFSRKLLLAGKPDYIVRAGGQIIPVEYKARAAPRSGPYKSHILQLASYCALIEHEYRTRPDYGVVAYKNQSFRIPYTRELEEEMLRCNEIVNKIKSGSWIPPAQPNAPEFCKYCAQREMCKSGG